jgi:hypothetical protein
VYFDSQCFTSEKLRAYYSEILLKGIWVNSIMRLMTVEKRYFVGAAQAQQDIPERILYYVSKHG